MLIGCGGELTVEHGWEEASQKMLSSLSTQLDAAKEADWSQRITELFRGFPATTFAPKQWLQGKSFENILSCSHQKMSENGVWCMIPDIVDDTACILKFKWQNKISFIDSICFALLCSDIYPSTPSYQIYTIEMKCSQWKLDHSTAGIVNLLCHIVRWDSCCAFVCIVQNIFEYSQ